MKKLILSLSILCSLSVNAAPAGLEPNIPVGTFNFSGAINVPLAKKIERVYTTRPEGKKKLQELMKKGWACTAQSSALSQCSIFERNAVLPEPIMNELKEKYLGYSLSFANAMAVTVLNEGELLSEFDVVQNVNIHDQMATSYTLSIIGDGLYKLRFNLAGANEGPYFNLVGDNQIETVLTEVVAQANQSTTYYIQILFSK